MPKWQTVTARYYLEVILKKTQKKNWSRKMPNGIMDGFFQKGNHKVNLGRHPMLYARLDIAN